MRTAILVDGAFFLRKYRSKVRSFQPPERAQAFLDSPVRTAAYLHSGTRLLMKLANEKHARVEPNSLYRVFFYDCPPIEKRVWNPISRETIALNKTPEAEYRLQLHEELRKSRKFALRLGELLQTGAGWRIKDQITDDLLKNKTEIKDLLATDIVYEYKQKGVDMKIGLDIASLAYKKLVGRIILISGDSDFVPAAKLARREGIDFVLATMGHTIKKDLYEHIDGLIELAWDPFYKPSNRAQGKKGAGNSSHPLKTSRKKPARKPKQ